MEDNFNEDRRKYSRFPIQCPLEYKGEDAQPKESSVTINIAEGGALISASRGLELSSNVIMKFKLQNELFFLIGKVRHVRRKEESDVHEIGVEFWDKPRTFVKKFYDELDSIKNIQKLRSQDEGTEVSLAEASLDWYKDFETWPQ